MWPCMSVAVSVKSVAAHRDRAMLTMLEQLRRQSPDARNVKALPAPCLEKTWRSECSACRTMSGIHFDIYELERRSRGGRRTVLRGSPPTLEGIPGR